jgi:hypothetical protein
MPEAFWHSPQPYTHPADDHQQKPAGGELVPDAQHTFEDLKHIHFSNRSEAELFVEQKPRFQDLVHRIGLPG